MDNVIFLLFLISVFLWNVLLADRKAFYAYPIVNEVEGNHVSCAAQTRP